MMLLIGTESLRIQDGSDATASGVWVELHEITSERPRLPRPLTERGRMPHETRSVSQSKGLCSHRRDLERWTDVCSEGRGSQMDRGDAGEQ